MELKCEVEVFNREGVIEAPSWGSIIVHGMGKESTPSEKPVIIVCTSSDSTSGSKYSLIGNISQLSIQYLDEGCCTISLDQPRYKIFISNADPSGLKTIVSYLLQYFTSCVSLCDLPAIRALREPINRIYLNCQAKYERTLKKIKPWSSNLNQVELLKISDCTLTSAGYQLVKKLEQLRTLRLENNAFYSSTFIEIKSRKLTRLHINKCQTQLQIPSIFQNDLCFRDSLTELHLEGNQWSEVPNAIFQFQNLSELSLSDNYITELPDTFTNLPKLTSLYLSNNRFKNVPSIIFEMQNLCCLSLSNNCISELPDKFTNSFKLNNSSLSKNQLRYLPLSILLLPITQLDVEDNEFNFDEIPPTFGSEVKLHSLQELTYRTILKHEFKVEEGMLPKRFLKDLDNCRRCVCGCKYIDGQDLSFSCNLRDILCVFDHDYIGDNPRIPIRGSVCTSLKLCFIDRFLRVN